MNFKDLEDIGSLIEVSPTYDVKLVGDFKDFKVKKENHFYLKNHQKDREAKIKDAIYKKTFKLVAGECNKDGNYTIDDFGVYFQTRRIDEIEQVRIDAMSTEELKEYAERQHNDKINAKRAERDSLLVRVIDPVVTNPLRWADMSEEEQERYKAYRLYLLDIPQQFEFPYIKIKSLDEFE